MSLCDCNQGRLPCTCKPIEAEEIMSAKRYWVDSELYEITDGKRQDHDVVMASDFDRVTAERDALQALLNAADQGKDDLSFQLKDREGSRRDWFEAAQAAEKRVDVLEGQRESACLRAQDLAVKLAERDALLRELMGCPQVVETATIPKGGIEQNPSQVVVTLHVGLLRLRKVQEALSASAEPKCDRCEGNGKYPILGACPKCGCAPVERDERAEFEKVFAEKMGTLPLLKNDSLIRYRGGMYVSDKALLAEIFWMARAALDKATEGASHE